MEPPPPPSHPLPFPQNSKASRLRKRALMEPDVIEIPPPTLVSRAKTSRLRKQKQVILHDVIDVDKDDDSADVMIIDSTIDTKNKGKAISNFDGYNHIGVAGQGSHATINPDNHIPLPGSHNIIDLDHFFPDMLHDDFGHVDDDDFGLSEDYFEYDDYLSLQAHFDNVDIPTGVEASIPWIPVSLNNVENANGRSSLNTSNLVHSSSASSWLSKPKPSAVSSSTVQIPTDYMSHASGVNLLSHEPLNPPAGTEKKIASSHGGNTSMSLPPWSKKALATSSYSSSYAYADHSIPSHGVGPGSWGHNLPTLNNQGGANNVFYPSFPASTGGLNHASGAWLSTSSYSTKLNSALSSFTSNQSIYHPFSSANNPPEDAGVRTSKNVHRDDILRKFQLFKLFDTVEDHSDHHYASKGSSTKQPPKAWSKKVQEEWRILENDLPDSIFVRVYESRMDILRAVIVGAEGTPYHDGLFFFDVFFPAGYPKVPPSVYYHSGGLRLNPNLYSCGKVCLSLLGTWSGSKNEKWLPGTSTVLQVLVSIQALILNQNPFFNEPGYERSRGTPHGEKQSEQYNESTFFLSLKTMVYTMRRPPMHFQDFVLGHFHSRARDILLACKAYLDGAQVGSLVKGGVQDVDESNKTCSKSFRDTLPAHIDVLMKEFLFIGVPDIESFQALASKKQ